MRKITSFQRITRSLCSLPRTMLNFLAFAWLPRWRLRLFILLGSWAVLFSFSLFQPSLSQALGTDIQQATGTPIPPSATNRPPLFPSSTPAPTLDYSCNGTQPVGWGTVTPDPYWLLNCETCVTRFPTPTVTSLPPTLVVTGTPATATATVLPDGLTYYRTLYFGNGCLDPVSQCEPYYDGLMCTWSGVTNNGSGNNCSFKLDFYDSRGPAVRQYYMVVDAVADGQYGYSGPSVAFFPPSDFAIPGSPSSTGLGAVHLERFGTIGNYADYQEFAIDWFNYLNYASFSGTLYIQPGEVVPTPMPDLPGYCGDVLPDTTGGSGEDPCVAGIMCLPEPTTGDKSCFGISEFSIPIGVLGIDTIGTPGVNICFQEIYFGKMIMWGMEIDLDYMALVFAAVALVRIWTRS